MGNIETLLDAACAAVAADKGSQAIVVTMSSALAKAALARRSMAERGDLARPALGCAIARAGVLVASPAEVGELLRWGGHLRGTPFPGAIIWDRDTHDEERARLDVVMTKAERECEKIRERVTEHMGATVVG